MRQTEAFKDRRKEHEHVRKLAPGKNTWNPAKFNLYPRHSLRHVEGRPDDGAAFIELGERILSAEAIGIGTLMAVEPGKGILAHRYANGTLHAYIALNKPEGWISAIDFSKQSAALGRIAKEFEGCAPQLRALITDSETKPVVRPIYSLPIIHRWERVAGVTLVGDAAHLMSPFAGEGANFAIYDGAELGKTLCANPGEVEAAIESMSGLCLLAARCRRTVRRALVPYWMSALVETCCPVYLFSGAP
jgi:hypothetical protein